MAMNDCCSFDEFFSSSQRRLNSNTTTSRMDDDDSDLGDEESMNDTIEDVESISSILRTEDDEDNDTSSTQTEEETSDSIITLKGDDRRCRDKVKTLTVKQSKKGHEQIRNTSLKIADCERQCLRLARSLGCVTVLQSQPPSSSQQVSPTSTIAAGDSAPASTSSLSSLKRYDSRRSSIASGSTSTTLIGCHFVSTSFDNDDIQRRRSSSLSLWLGLKEEDEEEGPTKITRTTTPKKNKATMSKTSITTALDTATTNNDAMKSKECATSSSSIISCSTTPTASKMHTAMPKEIANNADATINQCSMRSETGKAVTTKMTTIHDDITKLCLSPSSSSSSTTFDGTSTGTTTTMSSSSSCSYNHDMQSRRLLLPSKVSLWEQLHRNTAQRNECYGEETTVPVKNDSKKNISRSLHGNFKVNKTWNNNNNEQGTHHVNNDEKSYTHSVDHTVVHRNDFRRHQHGRSMRRRGDHRESRAQSLACGDVVLDVCDAGASTGEGAIEGNQDNIRQALPPPSSFLTNPQSNIFTDSGSTCIGRNSSRRNDSTAVVKNKQHSRHGNDRYNPTDTINHASTTRSDDSDTTWRTRLHHLLTSLDPIRESAGSTGGETLNSQRRAATGTDLPPLLRARTGISQSLHGYFKSNRHHCYSHFEKSHFAPTTSGNTNTTKRKTLRSGLSQSLHGLRSTVSTHSSTPTPYYKWCDNEISISIKNKEEDCTAEQQQHNKQHQRSFLLKKHHQEEKHHQEKKQSSRNNNVAATKQIYFGPDECFNVEVHKLQTLQTKNKRQLSNRSLYSGLTRNLHLKQKHGTS